MDDQKIAGVIRPAREDGTPVFEIIRRDHWMSPPEGVRPCEHGRFILDEQWATVTCKDCGEKVDPFSALMWYARNYQEVRRERERMLEAKKGLMIAELRRLSKLRDATDAEREEIAGIVRSPYRAKLEDCQEAVTRIQMAIRQRKDAKRRTQRVVR